MKKSLLVQIEEKELELEKFEEEMRPSWIAWANFRKKLEERGIDSLSYVHIDDDVNIPEDLRYGKEIYKTYSTFYDKYQKLLAELNGLKHTKQDNILLAMSLNELESLEDCSSLEEVIGYDDNIGKVILEVYTFNDIEEYLNKIEDKELRKTVEMKIMNRVMSGKGLISEELSLDIKRELEKYVSKLVEELNHL